MSSHVSVGFWASAELEEEASEKVLRLIDAVYRFGRDESCDFVVDDACVSYDHAELSCTADGGLVLSARGKEVYVQRFGSEWDKVEPGDVARLAVGHRWGLLRHAHRYRVLFAPEPAVTAGTGSFDAGYLRLLHDVERVQTVQRNKKGDNWTLDEQHVLEIELEEPEDVEAAAEAAAGGELEVLGLVPVTTLRHLATKPIRVETLWGLRGDADVSFLQRHGCHFWDAQAVDGWVGLNYGLMVNWVGLNQLDESVIAPLCIRRGEASRNMTVTLTDPNAETVQRSCTALAQFFLRDGRLDLALHQRSSDVVLGLPNDVVVWALILHFVRREVRRRTNDEVRLRAGRLSFILPAGAAHAYVKNGEVLKELLRRSPVEGVAPRAFVTRDAPGMFELAKDDDSPASLSVKGYVESAIHPKISVEQSNG